jgi:hypothetical protein
MKHQIALVETAQPSAEREILAAWLPYKDKGEPLGLEFGKVIHEWKTKLKSKGGYHSKGKGLSGILTVLEIPRHIADYWEARYRVTIGEIDSGMVPTNWAISIPNEEEVIARKAFLENQRWEDIQRAAEPSAEEKKQTELAMKAADEEEASWPYDPMNMPVEDSPEVPPAKLKELDAKVNWTQRTGAQSWICTFRECINGGPLSCHLPKCHCVLYRLSADLRRFT